MTAFDFFVQAWPQPERYDYAWILGQSLARSGPDSRAGLNTFSMGRRLSTMHTKQKTFPCPTVAQLPCL
jgi:hypothetical protein